MNHLTVFTASVADGATYAAVASIADQSVNIQNSRYTFQEDRKVTMAYARGVAVAAFRITTPMWRQVSYPSIWPWESAAAPGNLPPINFLGNSGLTILRNDELGVECSNSSGGAVTVDVGVWTQKQQRPAPGGGITSVRCTGAITGVTRAWTSGVLTFEQQLPSGKFAVVGFDVMGANLVFARLIFPQQQERPGVVTQQAVGEYNWPNLRNGGPGNLGEFYTYAPPQLEVYCIGANTAQQAYLDLVRLEGG